MEIRELLQRVKSGELDFEKAEMLLKKLPYEDLGFAKLDYHRKLRQGVGEVIFCQGKALDHLVAIFERLAETEQRVLGTRATQEQYKEVLSAVPDVNYDELSGILKIEKSKICLQGLIAVCTGGTADIKVAEEAAQTAEFFGSRVERFYDVGVAGIHRLFSKIDRIQAANCIIAIAGMEGALPGVVAGMVDKPVIAVPTSVGYGANFEGVAPLLTMLNSCANGVSVVNIDNGFGAGYIANQINRLANRPGFDASV